MRLVDGHEVYVSKTAYSGICCRLQISQNPSLVTKLLLDINFAREVLAMSNAKGARAAVNKKTEHFEKNEHVQLKILKGAQISQFQAYSDIACHLFGQL